MFYLEALDRDCAHYSCTESATHEVKGTSHVTYGKFCEQHAHKRLNMLDDTFVGPKKEAGHE